MTRLMTRKSFTSLLIAIFFLAGFTSAVSARGFDAIGAKGNGMGAAGVGLIDDENAGQWNPANLSLPSGTTYDEDYATSLGIQAGAQLQSTNNFYQNSKDLYDFFKNNSGSGIFSGNYDDSNRDEFIDLVALVGDLEGDDQGAIINATAGFNSRHTNWSFAVNNITDVASYTEFDITGGLKLSNTEVQDSFGDGDNSVSGSPSSSTYSDVASACESSFNKGSWDPSSDFGFSAGTNKSDLANFVANYAEDNNVSASRTKKFCESGNTILDQSASASSTDNNFDTKTQRIAFEGASITEASLSYAHPTPIAQLGASSLYVGGTFRFMSGRVAYVEENPFNSSAADSTSEIFDRDEDIETSSNVGVDIGLTYDARKTLGFKIGLVGKYLNSPDFDYPDNQAVSDTPLQKPDKLTIDPQLRVGISGYPLDYMPVDVGSNWWQLSADYDLTKNETLMRDYEKQYLAVGNEFNLVNSFWWNLALRAGARKNLAESAEGLLYTGGIGLQMAGLNIEVSGVYSDKTTKDEDGDEIPTLAGGHFNLAYRF